jgi:hypothetical protein
MKVWFERLGATRDNILVILIWHMSSKDGGEQSGE